MTTNKYIRKFIAWETFFRRAEGDEKKNLAHKINDLSCQMYKELPEEEVKKVIKRTNRVLDAQKDWVFSE